MKIWSLLGTLSLLSSLFAGQRFDVRIAAPDASESSKTATKTEPKADAKAKPAATAQAPRNIVYFTAPWCPACQRNKPTLRALETVGYRVLPYDLKKSANVFISDDDARLRGQFGVTVLPTWIVFESGKEVRRQVGVLSPTDVRGLLQAPKAVKIPESSDSDAETILQHVLQFTGPSGTFVFTPSEPVTAQADGVTLRYGEIKGRYETDGNTATITLDPPYPHADGRFAWGFLHYGANVLGIDTKPPTATIRTSLGKYRIRMEAVK